MQADRFAKPVSTLLEASMFEQAMLSSVAPGKRVCAAGIGFAGQALFVSFLLLVPLLWPQVLPSPQAMMTLGSARASSAAVQRSSRGAAKRACCSHAVCRP